ncbi:MAG TPA: ABC transporter ATP-binding protein [Firmicutes bacterium]|nr:ABC transporter ATP-binding protein [Bacillota bacterium]
MDELLKIKDLQVHFYTDYGVVKAVDGIDLTLQEGEALGILGESGCGKSMTALAVMGLVPFPGRITGGEIFFAGRDLCRLTEKEMRRLRGKEIAMIFQDPLTTLNPVLKVGEQITEAIRLHYEEGDLSSSGRNGFLRFWEQRRQKEITAWERAVDMMEQVGIPSPEMRMGEYPHQFSGGMRQRAMIAIALSCNPRLLIADEPTTALDVTIQAQILDLMRRIKEDFRTSILFISHDLGVISELCDRAAVMYAGKIVETGSVDEITGAPFHPYTQGILASIPRLGEKEYRIKPIPGNVPDLGDLPAGCSFFPRCPYGQPRCEMELPPLEEAGEGRQVRCFFWREIRTLVKEEGGINSELSFAAD